MQLLSISAVVDRAIHADAGLYDGRADRVKAGVALAGNFNTWAMEWRRHFTNQWGQVFQETLAVLDVDSLILDL